MQAKKIKPTRFYPFRLDIFLKLLYNRLMNKFKFIFSNVVKSLLAIAVLITLFGAGWNIYSLFAVKNLNALNGVGYALMVLINLFIACACLSILIKSEYQLKNGFLYTNFGLLRNKLPLEKITEVIHFIKQDKLVIYFDTESYAVIVIKKENYADFVSSLTKLRPEITYSVRGEETAEKN